MQPRILRFLIAPLVACLVLTAQPPQAPAPRRINLVILEGEGAVNNIKLRTARETIVQVEDENRRPVAGAVVAFLLPDNGPGGTFLTGAKSSTVVTDSGGRAVMPRVQLNNNPGQYQVRVTASFQGMTASATIAQSTIAGAAGVSTGLIVGIVAAVAAAGAVGVVVATRKDKEPPQVPGTSPSGTIGVGTGITLGPPR